MKSKNQKFSASNQTSELVFEELTAKEMQVVRGGISAEIELVDPSKLSPEELEKLEFDRDVRIEFDLLEGER